MPLPSESSVRVSFQRRARGRYIPLFEKSGIRAVSVEWVRDLKDEFIKMINANTNSAILPDQHVHTTNSPFRGFHIAPRKGGERAQDISASSALPSVSQAGETLCRRSHLISMGLVV
jgi:hypothetical protein